MANIDKIKYTMTDIHMHLVPGADDGAVDMEMALAMLLRAQEQGIRAVFATPHSDAFRFNPQRTRNQFNLLKDRAALLFPQIQIFPGCEIYCDRDIMSDVLDRLNRGEYPSMNAGKYVLVEFSMWVRPENTLCCMEALVEDGWTPILAHAERYSYLRGNMELLDNFRSMGCKIQINAYSLFEEGQAAIREWARRIVLEEKADFLGTDAHRTDHRPPCAAQGLKWLYENCPEGYADALARGNAQDLLMEVKERELC